MKPVLLAWQIAGTTIELPTYGVLVTLGFIAGMALVVRDGRARQLPAEGLLDLCWWILVAGLGGSRLAFVATHLPDFAARARAGDWLAPLRLWDGGLVFYGGALAATAVTALYARRRGWAFLMLADLFAPALVLGHALGRLGCFAAGCCYGKACPTDGLPCVHFPPGSVAHDQLGAGAAATPALYATQLFEAFALVALFVFLRVARKRHPPGQAPAGRIFLLYLTGYGSLRFLLELYRGDLARRFVFSATAPRLAGWLGLPPDAPLLLSTSQLVSLLLLAAAVAGLVIQTRRTPKPP